ncbi:hypothetical protein [Bacillus sp. Au-Bac7]|uniref:hypothetical protein n=1 Tax=Bacillus sp. Au-Bac7 TaxID=2906458 RepID=UPI001E61B715|nr:hypothetical protein [Bacillus sp. Au-Bac7]MCE4051851.1 hypothetical protein [Bacillus sp. Au-Bac7]
MTKLAEMINKVHEYYCEHLEHISRDDLLRRTTYKEFKKMYSIANLGNMIIDKPYLATIFDLEEMTEREELGRIDIVSKIKGLNVFDDIDMIHCHEVLENQILEFNCTYTPTVNRDVFHKWIDLIIEQNSLPETHLIELLKVAVYYGEEPALLH